MTDTRHRILWADDEIDMLRPHIMFLESKGYDVTRVSNGEDAVSLVRESSLAGATNGFDVIFLDEQMPGMGGLGALNEIKQINPALPVVMITKSEEEKLMEQAIGRKISDYLTKPVNPSQILLSLKKLLDGRRIAGEAASRDYIQEFNGISRQLMMGPTAEEWLDIHQKLSTWDVELDSHSDLGLRQTIADQKRECNVEFGKFVERNYADWAYADREDRPPLSVDVIREAVIPELQNHERPVVLFVVDCLRLDQWLAMEPLLYEFYSMTKSLYFSILPTATPYSRNAIFSGLFPADIEKRHPDLWARSEDDETSHNRFERDFLIDQLKRRGVQLKNDPKYVKIITADDAHQAEGNILSFTRNNRLTAVVVNFVDILTHSRSESDLLKEIAPDESALRGLAKTWFEHSALFNMLKLLATTDAVVLITTDHGSIRCNRGAKVLADRETSTNLRYKHGRNLKVDSRQAIVLKSGDPYRLPRRGVNTNYIIAKEDQYFVYPTNYHKYLNQYRDSFQHGGASLEEMVLPIVRLESKVNPA